MKRALAETYERGLYYAAAGMLAGIVLTAALAALRAFVEGGAGEAWRLDHEIERHIGFYGAAGVLLILSLAGLGAVLGRRADRMHAEAMTDPLTGLGNRRQLDQRLREELARAGRHGTALALLVVDIDHLKTINDEGGHPLGDEAVRAVASALRLACRRMDLPTRYAGDEFVVLAPGTTAADAVRLGERIRKMARDAARRWRSGPARRLSVSIGVVDTDTAGSLEAEALFAVADWALYAAKERGRDRVFVVTPVQRGEAVNNAG